MNKLKILFVWANRDQFGFKPIGISLLSSIAKQFNCEVKLFDTTEIDFGGSDNTLIGQNLKTFKQIDMTKYNINKKKLNLKKEFTKCFNEFQPDIVACSVLSDEFLIMKKINSYIKKLNKNTLILWGGKYPTLNPNKVLEYGVDYVFIGESTTSFKYFLKEIILHNNYDMKIEGILTKNYNGGIPKLLEDLNELPYLDWSIFDKRHFIKQYDGKVYIGGDYMSNWGCVNKCSYCINQFYHKIYNNKYNIKRFSNQRIIEELSYLKKEYNLNFLKFHDEDFLLRPLNNLKHLSLMYKKYVNIPFVIMTNSNMVTEEKVKILKDMGCVSVSIGIETGNEDLRKNILNRSDNHEQIINAFNLFKKYKIRTSSFNMLAIPYETRKTYFETVEINRKANVQYPNIGFFFPFEHTPLHDIAVKEKLFIPNNDVVYDHNKAALNLPNFTNEELVQLRDVFNLYVKLPLKYYKYIERSEKLDNVGKKLRFMLYNIYDETVFENDGWYKNNKKDYIKKLNKIMNLGDKE